jgi:Ni,Fe-hydrogenase III small subunit/formate hydrogenlyase subunit 6/NADH:ubiquinone oxidoreductase subunit I
MIKALLARLQQGHRTVAFPKADPTLPERFRGRPVVQSDKCLADCTRCIDGCPTGAIARSDNVLTVDLGRCLFCGQCAAACPTGALAFGRDYRLAAGARADLVLRDETMKRAQALDEKARSLFGRSLKLRQVSAGGCNACEADTNVLTTVVFDLGRFGIQFVASPRHADGLLVTGPVPRNMKLALEKTYEAVPDPKIVIAVGACAVSGDPYRDHPEVCNGVDGVIPVDLFIPGCPPHPITILDGLLRILSRVE